MKTVIQRVTSASVTVDGEVIGSIGNGLLVLLGVEQNDTKAECERLAEKIARMRIFADENDKTNLSVNDIHGDLLVISQFTLCADCSHGNRPSFINAGEPSLAEELYEHFKLCCREKIEGSVESGSFGADMKVSLTNDGPFTIVLECRNGKIL